MRVAVLSGAGISAESGVPTFRDDKNGLWARFDPYELSSTQGWLNNPERVWGWYLWRHYLVAEVEPNDGHRAIAAWQDGAWTFYPPRAGWLAYVLDENVLLAFRSGDWAPAGFDIVLPDRIGIKATADATNRLAVAAPASLFTNEGAGHQIKVNKASAGDTASLLFQTGWSGRAEMGLAGSDAFRGKVSADGASFVDAMVADPATGRVRAGSHRSARRYWSCPRTAPRPVRRDPD